MAAGVAANAVDFARTPNTRTNARPIADAAAYSVARIIRAYARSGGRTIARNSDLGLNGAAFALQEAAESQDAAAYWNSAAVDGHWIKSRHLKSPSGLISERLWIEDVRRGENFRLNFPIWARRSWDSLKRSRAAKQAGFDIWIRWYEALLLGRMEGHLDKTLGGEAENEVVFELTATPDDFWSRNAATVNADIKGRIEEAKKRTQSAPAPQVPKTRPAAIEPLWQGGKLTLPVALLPSDLDESSLLAALGALREDLAELAADVTAIQNIDHRPAEYLRRLADRIPDAMPSQALLFRLGHANEVLNDLARRRI